MKYKCYSDGTVLKIKDGIKNGQIIYKEYSNESYEADKQDEKCSGRIVIVENVWRDSPDDPFLDVRINDSLLTVHKFLIEKVLTE